MKTVPSVDSVPTEGWNEKSQRFCGLTPLVPTVPTYNIYIYKGYSHGPRCALLLGNIGEVGGNRERHPSNPHKSAKKTVPAYVGTVGTARWEQ